MRAIGVLTLILVAVAYMAFVWESPEVISLHVPATAKVDKDRWVRTRNGWEKPSSWAAPPPVYDPPIHPLALAGLQACLSLAALIAFPAQAKLAESETDEA